MKPTLSILIPCYNGENTVKSVVLDAYRVGKKVSRKLEIIVVNDASSDQTGPILKKLTKSIPPLVIITHKKNQGAGKTMKVLYLAAKNDWLFSISGDDQFDAKEIHKLLPQISHADMILGYRKNRHDSSRRLLQSKIYNVLLNIFFHLNLHDVNTIRLMRRSMIQALSLKSDTAFIDAEIAIQAKHKNFRILEIPIEHKFRKDKGATGGKFFKTIFPTILDMIKMIIHNQ